MKGGLPTEEQALKLLKQVVTYSRTEKAHGSWSPHNYIEKLELCSDGLCYWAYLWDCFKNHLIVKEDDCFKYIEANLDEMYIFWDINSQDRIFIPDYWKYPKSAVLKMSHEEFVEKLETFPEDIYIFNDEFKWSIALTHEDVNQERWCVFVMA